MLDEIKARIQRKIAQRIMPTLLAYEECEGWRAEDRIWLDGGTEWQSRIGRWFGLIEAKPGTRRYMGGGTIRVTRRTELGKRLTALLAAQETSHDD